MEKLNRIMKNSRGKKNWKREEGEIGGEREKKYKAERQRKSLLLQNCKPETGGWCESGERVSEDRDAANMAAVSPDLHAGVVRKQQRGNGLEDPSKRLMQASNYDRRHPKKRKGEFYII